MEQPIAVTRQSFDDWMVPVYAPADFILVREKDRRCGISRVSLTSISPAASRLTRWGMRTRRSRRRWWSRRANCGIWAMAIPTNRCCGQKLIDATFADKVFFCNSGAEANEAALKLARKHAHDQHGAGKDQIVAFNNAFHGRTLFTVSAGGQPKYSQDFAPLRAASPIRRITIWPRRPSLSTIAPVR